MDIWITRIVFVALLTYAGWSLEPLGGERPLLNLAGGLLLACGVILFEIRVRRLDLKTLLGALVGSITGIAGATLLSLVLSRMTAIPDGPGTFLQVLIILWMGYVGLLVGADKGNLLNLKFFEQIFAADRTTSPTAKILDTSVAIDGRVADICETGFLDGVLVVPQFVLHELQMIADSPDSAKRNRGRRGLDVLQRMQSMGGVTVQIVDRDYPDIREVDMKLIELALDMNAKIVTNDFNLNKVAQLRGVRVLNVNDLANAIKPIVLPGEAMRVFVLKEGKEDNQGVAYLDDGTMVVVDDGRPLIGQTIDITVTSMLQTTAGKMIFGRINRVAAAPPPAGAPTDPARNGRAR